MASNPPSFAVEDNTDEDFFDKLVEEDDFDPPGKPGFGDQSRPGLVNDSDEAHALANLSVGDTIFDGTGTDSGNAESVGFRVSPDSVGIERDNDEDGVVGVNNETGKLEVVDETIETKDGGSAGVKEVGWSSLFSDSGPNDGSDFFTGLGDDTGGAGFRGDIDNEEHKAESSVSYAQYYEGQAYSGTVDNSNDQRDVNSSVSYAQYYDGQAYSGTVDNSNEQQDVTSSDYWESLYPGWKYDLATGQWYEVGAQESAAVVQASHDATTSANEWDAISDQKSVASHLKQSVQPVTGTLAESVISDNVSGWNQAAQTNDDWNNAQLNNGYPEHMYFYPEYPDYYFDAIAQEWRLLESYTASIQSTGQPLDQQNNNGPNNTFANFDINSYGQYGQTENNGSPVISSPDQSNNWDASYDGSTQHDTTAWRRARTESVPDFSGNQLTDNAYSLKNSVSNHSHHRNSHSFSAMPSNGITSSHDTTAFHRFVPSEELNRQFNVSEVEQNKGNHFSNGYSGNRELPSTNQQLFQSGQQFPFVSSMERSSAGRPAHALVTFGFGGKLVVMRDNSAFSNSYGSQDVVGGSISVLNLAEVVRETTDASGAGVGSCGYFNALCKESFPGPLVGGNPGTKELNKWIDERIANCESPDIDSGRGRILKLLFSLLKIACQHYGKLRSPFGTDTTMRESDIPETAVAKLFASAKNREQFNQFGALNQCVQNLPSEAQIRATASEVQNLLVSGRKQEALKCAQEGQLWGPALVLASQLGDQFYVDVVKQMALRQLIAGSPLRTLCLLIAGQPAEVFSTDTTGSMMSNAMNFSQQQAQYGDNVMLDDWEENLAVITANRTKDDELVIIHLGDCLWKERSDIVAAHICYLVAEENFKSHSDGARLCLVGADHWKHPRTYASPEAIQRTELYEYSKVLGNSQSMLLPFQPYKLVYAHMLAEVGRVSDSLKYCQAVLKSLKTCRGPEVETWKQLVSSLEERNRAHQQGGYTGNLAPKKIVGKLLDFFDSTAHKVVGGLPPPVPSTGHGSGQGNNHHTQPMGNRVASSQSTLAMSSLMPSASVEPINEWSSDGNRRTMHNRSVSEPDFSRTPKQVGSNASEAQGKSSGSGGASRFSRFGFGSQILQKTVGLVLGPRSGRQAKLGEQNKFYYNEKLKMWVEEGAEPPAEESALPPPPTITSFQNGLSDINSTTVPKKEAAPPYSSPEYKSPTPADHSSGIPPIAPSSNQFSARGRMGVRARYVDTFNKSGGPAANSFHSPSVPSAKPAVAANAKFFIPTPATPVEKTTEAVAENMHESTVNSESPTTCPANEPVQNHAPQPPVAMQRFPSMDNISREGPSTSGNGPLPSHSRRTASWSGSLGDVHNHNMGASKLLGEALGMSPLSFSQNNQTSLHTASSSGSFGDDLHEVEL